MVQVKSRTLWLLAGMLVALTMSYITVAVPTMAAPVPPIPSLVQPDFGPNVMVFDPSMPISQIQTTVNNIASQQVDNEMGTQRYALLFKPGTYGTAANPLVFQVGYYTDVAGLGHRQPMSLSTDT